MPEIRTPTVTDAASVHRLVRDSEALETNSLYAYLLVCTHFGGTSVVADATGEQTDNEPDHPTDNKLDGFVAAYRPPTGSDSVFVWQVGVRDRARGRGLASSLLDAVLELPGCDGVRFLEATVAPSNHASDRLFRSLADRRGVECVVTDYIKAEHFGPESHEDERLYRIGPFASHA